MIRVSVISQRTLTPPSQAQKQFAVQMAHGVITSRRRHWPWLAVYSADLRCSVLPGDPWAIVEAVECIDFVIRIYCARNCVAECG